MKRSWRSRLGEFFLWALLSVVIAFVLVQFVETLIPPNF